MVVIVDIRKKLGLTQGQMGARLGCTQGAVSNYEQRTRELSIGVARQYLTLAREARLKTTLDEIFGPAEMDL